MRIRAKETIKHHPYYLSAGDVVTVDDAAGKTMIDNGWAENVDTGESAPRATEAVTLDVHAGAHASTDTLGG